MITFMMHKEHGYTHAYDPREVEVNISNGWKIASVAEEKTKPEMSTAELKKIYTEKFGKKPHWNLNRHNLKKAIKGD
jgi:hypothetical protein